MSNLKVQDLRVGNFVYGLDEFQGTALPICSLHSDNTLRLLVGDKSIGCFSANAIEPIELDTDWLEKFGFKMDFECNEFQFNGGFTEFTLMKSETGLFNCYEISLDGFLLIKYVHQLQNLFYSLTGKDLECQ